MLFLIHILLLSFIHAQEYIPLVEIPPTPFSCQNRSPGFYADSGPASKCRVYHLCDGSGIRYSYLCPNRTLFDQRHLACAHWYNVHCDSSTDFYSKNDDVFNFDTNVEDKNGIKPTDEGLGSHEKPDEPNFTVSLSSESIPKHNNFTNEFSSSNSKLPINNSRINLYNNTPSPVNYTHNLGSNQPENQASLPYTINVTDGHVEKTSNPVQESQKLGVGLTRDEFFEKIGNNFGEKISMIKEQTTEAHNLEVSNFQIPTEIPTIDDSLRKNPPLIDPIKPISRQEFFDLLDNQNQRLTTSKPAFNLPKIETTVKNSLNSDGETTENSVQEPNPLKSTLKRFGSYHGDLDTGEDKNCHGCMSHFIKDFENCFPCVFPR